jgi:type IV secretion system protein VirB9
VRRGVLIATDAGGTADRNLMMEQRGAFLFLKPLGPLVPQPITVLTQQEGGQMRRYTFQLETRSGSMTAEDADAFYAVKFTYPADEAAAKWARAQEQREAPAGPHCPGTTASERHRWRDSLQCALPGPGRCIPGAVFGKCRTHQVGWRAANFPPLPGQSARADDLPGSARCRKGVVGQSADPGPTTGGTLGTLYGVAPMLRLRDGKAVLCIINQGYDPTSRNPGTGTISPDVVRELAPKGRPRVR